jgi:hypothetical protein
MNDSPVVRAAAALALRAHANQRRKAGNVPYFTHLEAVAKLVAEHGHDDEVTVAAAYLHDLLEDQPEFAAELRATMPASVVETVEVLSEDKFDAEGNKRPKQARFEDYCAALQQGTAAARRALPISAADKIHNALSLVLADPGEGLLLKLSTKPDEHRIHHTRLRTIYSGNVSPSLLSAFDAAVKSLLEMIASGPRKNLYVQLDDASVTLARSRARLPVLRGEHVTLGYQILPGDAGRSLPGAYAIGDGVELRGVSEHADSRVQVWVVEIDGERRRREDGGTLHITISRADDARSRDANDVLLTAAPTPIDVGLRGVITWAD